MDYNWEKVYSVGIKLIDSQHKKLFKILNKLAKGIKKETKELKQIIKECKDYTIYHFNTEEKYFKEFNYKHSKEHIKEHKKFIKKISDFEKLINKNEFNITSELTDFLFNWIINHIIIQDKKYSKLFKENKLK